MQDEISCLLTNWARWLHSGRGGGGTCFSIEGRYRRKTRADDTPTGWGDWLSTPPGHVLPPIDELAALRVERTMRHLPVKHRKALTLHFLHRVPERRICQRLGLRYVDWDGFLHDAMNMVENLLTKQDGRNNNLSNSDFPSQDDAMTPGGAVAA